jgi:hypothetical protein
LVDRSGLQPLNLPLVEVFDDDYGHYKPLTSALGLRLPKPLRGIMVTTRRSPHIHRFSAAHELSHGMV